MKKADKLKIKVQARSLRKIFIARIIFFIAVGLSGIYISYCFATTFTDTYTSTPDGTHSDTEWDTSDSIDLTTTGKTNGSGNYTSSVMDNGENSSWDNIAWVTERPIGKELPNSSQSETVYASGNANMTGNVLLMHMNEASGAIVDYSGAENDGTYNGALYSQTGKINTAIGFDGDDYVSVSDDASLRPSEITVSAWVKADAYSHQFVNYPVSKFVSDGWGLGVLGNYNGVCEGVDGRVFAANPTNQVCSTTALNIGEWYHIAFTHNGSDATKVYINGVEEASGSLAWPDTTGIELRIGARGDNGWYFDGDIDEVAIFSRVLTPTEIADHYKRGSLKLKYQVRSCDDDVCSGETFIGPTDASDYYEWGTTNSIGTPTFSLTNVLNNRYFQYKGYFETDNSLYTPESKSVTVDNTIINLVPDTPTNSSPSDEATRQSITPTLTSSAFSDSNEGDTHLASQWQVTSESGNYASPIYDSGIDTTNKTSITIPSSTLSYTTTYYWHVRHEDNNSAWSAYSTEFSFTTAAQPSAPTNSLPSSGALNQKITPTLTSSAFSDPDEGASQSAAQWQIRSLSDTGYSSPVYDSGTDTSNKTSIAVPSGNLSKNTTYFWKVRHKDDVGHWSSYSSETAFTTGVTPINVISVGATEYQSGETAKLTVQIASADGTPVNDATTTITIYNPSNSAVVSDASVTYLTDSNGIYFYNYTVPETEGVYTYQVKAVYSANTTYSSHAFHVSPALNIITTLNTNLNTVSTNLDTANSTLGTIDTNVTDVQSNMDILIGALIVTQSTVNDASATTTSFVSALINSTDDFYNNAVLTFNSATLDGQTRRISDYDGTSKTITLSPALTSAPANGVSFTIIKQNVYVEQQVGEHETAQAAFRTDTTAKLVSIESKIDTISANLDTVDTNLDTVLSTINTIRTSQQKDYRVILSDVSEIQIDNTYRAKLTVQDFESNPVDASTLPTIVIYDSTRAEAQASTAMTKLSTGVYEYTFAVSDSATTGLYESVVNIDVSGTADIIRNDFWQVTGSPAQVLINSISDLSVPSIAADATITNEGGGDFEYQYEWCVVSTESNQCGGDDDVYHATGAKLIAVGESYNPTLTATVPDVGNYWFKLVVYYGTESSGASLTFTAGIEEEVVAEETAGGGTAPSGGRAATPSKSNLATDKNIYDEIIKAREELNLNAQELARNLELLEIINPSIQNLLSVSALNTESLIDIQNKLADLQAVSSVTRQYIGQETPKPIVETYMKFNSVEIHFLITNPDDTEQTVKFKEFLPEEVKPENIIDKNGLNVDYDPNAKMYYVSGDITLGPKESTTRKVEMKDIWVFNPEETKSIRDQTNELISTLAKTQYEAQGSLLKNDIDTNLKMVLLRQDESYSSPQNHIVVYRENVNRMAQVENNLDKLKDLVVQAGAARGMIGQVGGIQTFATWGIILAIIFGFGLLAAIIFAMWRHQTMLAASTMRSDPNYLMVNPEATRLYKNKLFVQKSFLRKLFGEEVVYIKIVLCAILAVLAIKYYPILFNEEGLMLANEQVSAESQIIPEGAPVESSPEVKVPEPVKDAVVLTSSVPRLIITDTPTGWLNVREAEGLNSTVLTKVYPNEYYEYTDQRDEWYRIILKDKTEGWVYGEYIKKVKKLKIDDNSTGWLNVRGWASSDATILTKVYPDEYYECTDQMNGWYRIILKDKTEGWVSGVYIIEIKN